MTTSPRSLPKVLLVHDYYLQRGGEDFVFEEEGALLESKGCRVIRYSRSNDRILEMGRLALLRTVLGGEPAVSEIRQIVRREKPDVVHFHNTFPLITPAACRAAKEEGAAVVVTLHNYRRICLNGLLFRSGRVCEDCAKRTVGWPGVLHACYRHSRTASAVVAWLNARQRRRQIWERSVDRFIVLSEFSRRKLEEAGLDVSRMVVKPNHVQAEGEPGPWPREPFALFVGRLTTEKGVSILLKAWEGIGAKFSLKIAGEGPVGVDALVSGGGPAGVEWMGWKGPEDVRALMRACSVLVVPSTWYEICPRTIMEAFAVGTPVLASRLGSMAEFVDDGRNGLLFEPGNPGDLAEKATRLLEHPEECRRLGLQAREDFLAKYTADRNFDRLMQIYGMAMSARHSRLG
ncbi:MAG: glycosyltransferase family 4 protein [Planctomycetota bacterium]